VAAQVKKLGVFEIFFGPAWSEAGRLSYASFLSENELGFYLYGPKADQHLRKRWGEDWSSDYLKWLGNLAATFNERGVKFGVALSPLGLQNLTPEDASSRLRRKVALLEKAGVSLLGVFFDDMPVHAGLAENQIACIRAIQSTTAMPILFCPSYYSTDPILDQVFGARPPEYLREIGEGMPKEVEILWTGPKVISPEISAQHLLEVGQSLRRKPFVCDNLFANDGPKNCKFLKLAPLLGRTAKALNEASHWAFNPMNQSELSKIVLLGAQQVLLHGMAPRDALSLALEKLCSPDLAFLLESYGEIFLEDGLDGIDESELQEIRNALREMNSLISWEILGWLNGDYTVDSDCLTD
jgi:hyaluronoglucosaminidase